MKIPIQNSSNDNLQTRLNTSIRLFIFFISISIVFAACASQQQIEMKKFIGYSEIKPKEDLRLEWSFNNAEYVKIDGLDRTFSPNDVFVDNPEKSRSYTITAYSGNDSLSLNSLVEVLIETPPTETRPGPEIFGLELLGKSNSPSEYLCGTASPGKGIVPAQLRTMRIINASDSNQFKLRAIVLDEFGNYISNLQDNANSINWTLEKNCNDNKIKIKPSLSKEEPISSSATCDFCIMLDNSFAATANQDVVKAITSFVPYLSATDNFSMWSFNQQFEQLITTIPAEEALKKCKHLYLPTPSGLNAIYKAAFGIMPQLNKNSNQAKALVAITYLSDNSSVIYTANDVGKISKDYDIPFYIIAIGDAVECYTLQYLTNLCGGRFYHINEDEIPNISKILTEIAFAQKSYYEIDFDKETIATADECNIIPMSVIMQSNSGVLHDNTDIVLKPEAQYSNYQALALFDEYNSDIHSQYDVILSSLAKVLRDNPHSVVELIGNSSKEGANDEEYKDISIRRSQAVRAALLALEVPPQQIRLRADGFSKPIFYLEQEDWQKQLNRRVEVRWLDPSVLPFEIIADEAQTEDDAIIKVERWEKRKFKVYFERIIRNNESKYLIKLWGYATLEAAQSAIKGIEKQYGGKYVIE